MEPVTDPADTPRDLEFRRIDLRFTGSGSEYFRIWIVNLLLLFLTLGFYWPWAKVRRLRYFWNHTLFDGDPLEFHGDAARMFKGWLLVGVLFGLYNWAGTFSALAGLVAFVALGALWPALWRSSMAFRLGNTSWRGLRFRFAGSQAGAYAALMPSFLVVLPLVVLGLWMPEDPEAAPADWVMVTLGVAFLVVLAVVPWLTWRMKAYQHRHYALGTLQTDFRARLRSFYALFLKALLWLLAPLVLLAGLALAAAWFEGHDSLLSRDTRRYLFGMAGVLLFGFFLVVMMGLVPWWVTRMQNLVWTKTGNERLRFISRLGFRRMLWLRIKNGVLILLTLGLYWPFAAVATARLRLEAVHVRSRVDLDGLVASAHESPKEAAGEAAGDFFGMDVGL